MNGLVDEAQIAAGQMLVLAGTGSGAASPPAAATAAPSATQPQAETSPGLPTALVVRVIDGDTVELEDGSRVRYIGMDTPESTIEHDCYGEESSARNKALVQGRILSLENDVSETDRFGRLLRYVCVDGVEVNEQLVLAGRDIPTGREDQDRFLVAQQQAHDANGGLLVSLPGSHSHGHTTSLGRGADAPTNPRHSAGAAGPRELSSFLRRRNGQRPW